MNSSSTHFVSSGGMGVYDPIHQIGMWGETFRPNGTGVPSPSIFVQTDNQSEDTSHGSLGTPNRYDQEANKLTNKVQRRLAQNREAARKSRLRKKAYVQQLESSQLKLIQLEKELERTRQQGVYVGAGSETSHPGISGSVNAGLYANTNMENSYKCEVSQLLKRVKDKGIMELNEVDQGDNLISEIKMACACIFADCCGFPGIAAFEMEYGLWVEEQKRKISELRNALSAHISDAELRTLIDNNMKHYSELFRMKTNAAKSDVFYVISGMWRTPSERFFLWIGGFRPSKLLEVLVPQLDVLTESQLMDIRSLKQSCQQAEDALSQGLEKLQHHLADTVATIPLGEGDYIPQLATAIEKLEAIISFVNQADHIRNETLLQMSRILTTRQAARGLLALGEYFQRLQALSSIWATRPREPA